jgi:two-component system, LuxR family, response regulator FixJ
MGPRSNSLAGAQGPRSPPGLSMMRGKVLVVDDDASVRKSLHRLVRAAGYDVETLDGAAAYLARAAEPPPACLLLDIRMPGMSGLDLLRVVEGTARALPIVFISGHGDEEVRAQALAAGAVDVLYKPLDETTLLAAIDHALALSSSTS